MSYKNIDNLNDKQNSKEIIKDIITRKEYYSLKTDNKKRYDIAGIIKNIQIKQLSNEIIPKYKKTKISPSPLYAIENDVAVYKYANINDDIPIMMMIIPPILAK